MGEASIWSPFSIETDSGYSRIVIFDKSLNGHQFRKIIRLALDLWTYSFLIFSLAPAITGQLGKIDSTDEGLTDLLNKIEGGQDSTRANAYLRELRENAQVIEAFYADLGARFSAIPVYAEIVKEKLSQLEMEAIAGTQNIVTFIMDRVMPAVRLCEDVENRLKSLSKQNARAMSLVGKEVELGILRSLDTTSSNTLELGHAVQTLRKMELDVINSLDLTGKRILHLQIAIEVLSVVPLTYYAGHILETLSSSTNKDVLYAVTFIVVFLSMTLIHWFVKRLK